MNEVCKGLGFGFFVYVSSSKGLGLGLGVGSAVFDMLAGAKESQPSKS